MIDFDYSGFTITVLAAEIEEEVVRVKNLQAAIDDLPEARERLAALKAEMAKRVAPEQPKDTSNEDGTETDIRMSDEEIAAKKVAEYALTKGGGTIVDCSEDEGTPAPLPVEPMADLSGAADEVLTTNGVYDVGDRTYAFGAEISNGALPETD